jgi:hypothetical protein
LQLLIKININLIDFLFSIISVDEPRIESPRKPVIEEPIKPVVAHTREQVIQLCHEAIRILYNQNTDFSDRSAINRTIPDFYFNSNQEGN